jgi:acyl-[acyl-carrier-protein]-phospholipid O-acyltransferase/long-chain-fatty-acid--[acyl-carrier-protein] ligase
MVPHIQIEEILNDMLQSEEEGGLKAVVTAVPDEKKGERLVVLHTAIDMSPSQLCEGLVKAGFPNLYIPSEDSFVQVDELPVLGTGKLDLRGMRQLAEQRFAPDASPSS